MQRLFPTFTSKAVELKPNSDYILELSLYFHVIHNGFSIVHYSLFYMIGLEVLTQFYNICQVTEAYIWYLTKQEKKKVQQLYNGFN